MRSVQCLAVVAALTGSAMPAYCQTAPTGDKIKMEISRAELQIIGQGLMELPYKTVAPVLQDLQVQLNAADAAAAKAAADAKAVAEAKPADKPVAGNPDKGAGPEIPTAKPADAAPAK